MTHEEVTRETEEWWNKLSAQQRVSLLAMLGKLHEAGKTSEPRRKVTTYSSDLIKFRTILFLIAIDLVYVSTNISPKGNPEIVIQITKFGNDFYEYIYNKQDDVEDNTSNDGFYPCPEISTTNHKAERTEKKIEFFAKRYSGKEENVDPVGKMTAAQLETVRRLFGLSETPIAVKSGLGKVDRPEPIVVELEVTDENGNSPEMSALNHLTKFRRLLIPLEATEGYERDHKLRWKVISRLVSKGYIETDKETPPAGYAGFVLSEEGKTHVERLGLTGQ